MERENVGNGVGLRWGIKRSFVQYVLRMSDGRATATDGARPLDDGDVVFEAGTPSREGDALVLPFRGDVRFAGHFGMLFVRVADPVITLRGDEAEMTIADPYPSSEEGAPVGDRVLLASFTAVPVEVEPGRTAWASTDVRLAESGAELFNGVYAAGEPLEPLAIVIPEANATA